MSKPQFKVFESERGNDISVELGWWDETRLNHQNPEYRLLKILTKENDLVVSIPAVEDRLAYEAVALGRRVLQFTLSSVRGPEFPNEAKVNEEIATWDPLSRLFTLDYEMDGFVDLLLSLEGFFPTAYTPTRGDVSDRVLAAISGIDAKGERACRVLEGGDWPKSSLLKTLETEVLPFFKELVVYYYRGRPSGAKPRGLSFKRIPFDLSSRPSEAI